MAVYRTVTCPVCNGRGYVYTSHCNEFSAWVESHPCEDCKETGRVIVSLTNSERLAGLKSPEDQLKFLRGFDKWAKYAGTPLRLINPEEYDEDMIEWLNKVSDESDDFIFENR